MLKDKIKIGRDEYDLKSGDYILFNGVVYLFCSGDGRVLKRKGFDAFRYVQIPQSTIKKLPLKDMKQVTDGNCKYYYIL